MDSILGLVRHAGNDALFRAIEMSMLATLSGQPLHVHAEGLRGTGKTTIMRAVRRVLPRILRIKDCLYNCDPALPHCPAHRGLTGEEVVRLGEEWIPIPFLEISHSAKVGTVVGSIDLSRLVSHTRPEAALLPGTLPQAHRGIIFVDEINRLAETSPELADILLDAMGTKPGRIQIEETGLPAVELPVQVTVWAASNPDEDPGPLEDIRRQLSDRFDFVIYTDRPGDASVVEQILAGATGEGWHRPMPALEETEAELFRTRLVGRLPALRAMQVSRPLQQQIADLYSRFNVESLRAVQAIHLGIRLAACMEQREEASVEDLARISPLALRHRVDQETIKKVTAHLAGMHQWPEVSPTAPAAAGAKQRFPTISFGGAAVGPVRPHPVPDQESPWGPARSGAGSALPSVSPPTDGPSAVPRAAASQPELPVRQPPRISPVRSDSWLTRTLSGLRRYLSLPGGHGETAGKNEPEPRRPNATEQGLRAPRPGRAFPSVDPHPQVNPGVQSKSANAQAPQALPDPTTMPGVAPPHPARPIVGMNQHELIRTEEELGRR